MHYLVPTFILNKTAQSLWYGCFPATALMVDISGFTIVTEALLQHGQHGAEVLATIMRAVFEPLVSSVYTRNGFIIGFAGDSFIAIFPETKTVERATQEAELPRYCATLSALAAGRQMQQWVTTHARQATPYGEFTFSARVGIAAGEVEWEILQAADGNRAAYYFRGTAVQGSTMAERMAHQGEIVLNAAAYADVRPWVTGQDRGAGFIQVSHITAPEPPGVPSEQLQPPPVTVEEASRFFPRQIITQPLRGEFRYIFNLFINLPDGMNRDELNQFMETVFALQKRYGGLLNRVGFDDKGCHLLLFWGAPVSYENDVSRGLNFILALQARSNVTLRAGVTYRIAHAGFIGSPLHEEYTCYGRGVNLAARLMTAAPWGDIWLDERIAERVDSHFILEFAGRHAFKGFATLQPVFVLKGRRPAAKTRYRAQLIGRDAELARLRLAVEPILKGRFAGLVTILGEAGIGKSHLVHTFLESFPDPQASGTVSIYLCQTDEVLRQSLNPFRYWLRSYFDQSPAADETRFREKLESLITVTASPHLCAELERTRSFLGALVDLYWPHSLYEQAEPRLRFENTLIALRTLILAESLRRPVILFLEDGQWLDEDSRHFLKDLINAADAFPLAVVMTLRLQPGLSPSHFSDISSLEIHLGALVEADIARLSAALTQMQLAPELTALVTARTDGNPFFAEQLILYLQEQGLLTAGVSAAEQALPWDVRAVLIARLDQLPQEVKQVVQAAAVLGREFAVQVLAQILQPDAAVLDKVKTAEAAAVWIALSEIRYLFKHALLRDAAYEMQLHARRLHLHSLALEALETLYATDLTPYYAELAYHARYAGRPEREFYYAIRAGERAVEQYSNQSAITYFQRAVVLQAGLPDAQPASLAAIHQGLGRIYHRTGRYDEAAVAYQAMLRAAQAAQDSHLEVDAWLAISNVMETQGQNRQALALAIQVEEIVRSWQVPDLPRLATAIYWHAWMRNRLGESEMVITLMGESLQLCRQVGDKTQLANGLKLMGFVYTSKGQYEVAKSYLLETQQLYQAVGNRRGASTILNQLGEIARLQGKYRQAADFYGQALTIARELGARSDQTLFLSNMGGAQVGMGQYEAAVTVLKQVIDSAGPNWFGLAETYRFLAEAYLGLGQSRTALLQARQSLALAQRTSSPDLVGNGWLIMGRLATQMGEAVETEDGSFPPVACFEQAAAVFRQAAMERDYAVTLYYWGAHELREGRREHGEALQRESRTRLAQLEIEPTFLS